jgi:hypothetical protein
MRRKAIRRADVFSAESKFGFAKIPTLACTGLIDFLSRRDTSLPHDISQPSDPTLQTAQKNRKMDFRFYFRHGDHGYLLATFVMLPPDN